MICLPCLIMEARTWVKKHDIHEEEKDDDGSHINNLIELSFLKIFYLMCLTWKKAKVGILVGIVI
jgi:hypothetical protein